MTDDLTAPLATHLAEPAPPPTFKAAVMARIAREADRSTAPAGVRTAIGRRASAATWLWTAVGFALVAGATIYGWVQNGTLPAQSGTPIGLAGLTLIPPEVTVGAALGSGLLVYLAGLFAPLRIRRRI